MEEFDLERELQQELENLDKIFQDTVNDDNHVDLNADQNMNFSFSNTPYKLRGMNGRFSLTAYELAEAESEREELQDKLRLLLSKTEEYDQNLAVITKENQEIKALTNQLSKENESLRKQLEDIRKQQQVNNNENNDNSNQSKISKSELGGNVTSNKEFQDLEFKLAETKSKLARMQQAYEDLQIAKELALQELEQEKLARMHIEKERDAFSAAYEASLMHIEKWSKVKAKQSTTLSFLKATS